MSEDRVDDLRDGIGPVDHPWRALLERYGADPRRQAAIRRRVVVVWWRTRSGSQPVILVIRRRLD
jgi:hypothetical protein